MGKIGIGKSGVERGELKLTQNIRSHLLIMAKMGQKERFVEKESYQKIYVYWVENRMNIYSHAEWDT